MIRIAILDDYQNASLEMADWSPLAGRAVITVFNDHLSNFDKVVERLLPFDVVCVMRERTSLPRSVIGRLPRLKLIASTGPRNAAIDVEAAAERGIVVAHTGYDARSTIEMTWALILASARQVALENAHLRAGGWQLTMGDSLHGKTLYTAWTIPTQFVGANGIRFAYRRWGKRAGCHWSSTGPDILHDRRTLVHLNWKGL